MVAPAASYALMETVWKRVSARFSAYQLALPGSSRFICQASACGAQCCRAFSVNLGEQEVRRFSAASGLSAAEFLECEEGEPIVLPLAQPYVLARENGQCRQLGGDLGCGNYAGRPNACRLYPHFIIFIDRESMRPVHGDLAGIRRSFEAAQSRDDPTCAPYVALLLRHVDCPGFTGAPMSEAEWQELFAETFALQYEAE